MNWCIAVEYKSFLYAENVKYELATLSGRYVAMTVEKRRVGGNGEIMGILETESRENFGQGEGLRYRKTECEDFGVLIRREREGGEFC